MEKTLKSSLKVIVYIVGTRIGGYIAISIVIFGIIAAFWGWLFEMRFPYLFGDTLFASSLNRLESVIFASYLIWLRNQTEGFTNTTRQYSELLERIKLAGQRLSSTYKVALFSDEKIKEKTLKHVKHMNLGLQFLAFYCYKLFDPKNSDKIEEGPWSQTRDERGKYAMRRATFEEAYLIQSSEITRLPDIPEELKEVLSPEYSAEYACLKSRGFIFEEFSMMSSGTELTPQSLNKESLRLVVSELSAVKEVLTMISSQRRVSEPQIFDVAAGLLLVGWFGVWLPITIWIQFFTVWTIFIYSILMFAITSPWIFRQSLGHPFRSILNQQWKWRNDTIDFLQIELRNAIESSEEPEKSISF